MITIINTPSIHSCFLPKLKRWINLADIQQLEVNEENQKVLITWRNGDKRSYSNEDATTIFQNWRVASAKAATAMDDKGYFLMDKRDYCLQVLALGLAIKEIASLGKTNPDFENSDFGVWLEAISQQAKEEFSKLEYWDVSYAYLRDRGTPENKILAAITQPSKTHEGHHVLSIF